MTFADVIARMTPNHAVNDFGRILGGYCAVGDYLLLVHRQVEIEGGRIVVHVALDCHLGAVVVGRNEVNNVFHRHWLVGDYFDELVDV